MYQKFNITSSDKHKLAMELIFVMDTCQKEPLMKELVKGSTIIVECINNKSKTFVHIPRCSSTKALAMSQATKYKFISDIVGTLGTGAKKVAGSLNKGELWLCAGDWQTATKTSLYSQHTMLG
jgi:hypothetical protein